MNSVVASRARELERIEDETHRRTAERGDRILVRGALALLTTQPLTWGASLLAAALLPRLVGAAELGEYAVAMNIGALGATAVSMGVPTHLRRSTAADPASARAQAFAAATALTVLAGLLALGTYLAFRLLGATLGQGPLLPIVLTGMTVAVAQGILFALLVGLHRHASFAWLNALASVTSIVGGLIAIAVFGTIAAYAASALIAGIVVTAFAWRLARARLLLHSLVPSAWLRLAIAGAPFLGWELALKVRGDIDIVIAGIALRDEVAGWLAAAYHIVYIPIFIPTVITTPLLPLLSEQVRDEELFRRTLRYAVRGVLVLTVASGAVVVAMAPSIPALLGWAPGFTNSVPVMQLLALEQPIMAIDMVLGTALIAMRKERQWLVVAVIAAIFNPLANVILLPFFDLATGNAAIGAGVAELATELIMLGGALILLPRGILTLDTASIAGRAVCAAVAFVALVMLLRDIPLILAVSIGGFVFVGVAFILRLVTLSELRSLLALSRGHGTALA